MKTWEMIKELTENPEKEFVRTTDGLHVKTNKDGVLIWNNGYQFIRLNHTWEEVKKPVDFMTAVKAFESGKNIYCKYDGYRLDFVRKPYGGLVDSYKNPISSSDILYREWYIE